MTYSTDSDTFYKYYQQQSGGALAHIGGIPVFMGSRRQRGAGLGDILRSAFRWFLPVAKRGAMTFAKSMIQNLDQGSGFRDAAKQAIRPTLNAAGEAVKDKFASMQTDKGQSQSGSGVGRHAAVKHAVGQPGNELVYKAVTNRKRAQSRGKKRKQVKKQRRVKQNSTDPTLSYNF